MSRIKVPSKTGEAGDRDDQDLLKSKPKWTGGCNHSYVRGAGVPTPALSTCILCGTNIKALPTPHTTKSATEGMGQPQAKPIAPLVRATAQQLPF